ncbi:MAG: hypothetical protein ACLFPL_00910 [Candidatus Nanoarchaeia archaeon]
MSTLQSTPISFKSTPLCEICENFSIPQEITQSYFSTLYLIQGVGVCLSKQLISHNLMLIELKGELVPTQFFYSWLKEHISTNQLLTLQSQKWCNEWLYSKDVPLEFGVTKASKKNITSNNWYLVFFYNRVVGIGEVEEDKKFLKNWYNISAYLFEE